MSLEYQPTGKLRTRFSFRLNPSAASSGNITTRSHFGDQLSRQLEAQLRMQKISAESRVQSKAIGRSHSLSSVPQFPTCVSRNSSTRESLHRPERAGSLGHGSLSGWSSHRGSCQRSGLCLTGSVKGQLNRHSSTSSCDSYISFQSNGSRASSPFYHLPSGPSSVGEVEGDEDDNEQWSEFIRLKSNSFNPCAIVNVTPSSGPTRLSTPRPKAVDLPISVSKPTPQVESHSSFKSPMKIIRTLSLNFHSGTSSRGKKPMPASASGMKSRESLYELPESPRKDQQSFVVQGANYKPVSHGPSATAAIDPPKPTNLESRRVKFNPETLDLSSQSGSAHSTETPKQSVTRMACVRPGPPKPSIKRSLSMNASLDTIPEDSRLKMCLLSRTGMTL